MFEDDIKFDKVSFDFVNHKRLLSSHNMSFQFGMTVVFVSSLIYM